MELSGYAELTRPTSFATSPFGANTWADTSGVGDPDNNWAYAIIAVGSNGFEVYRPNRFGE